MASCMTRLGVYQAGKRSTGDGTNVFISLADLLKWSSAIEFPKMLRPGNGSGLEDLVVLVMR